MARSFGSPGRYIQRVGEIDNLGAHLAHLGKKPLILIDGFLYEKMRERIARSLGPELSPAFAKFGGECSEREIERVTEIVAKGGHDLVVGVGGGKTIDTAKMAAFRNGARIGVVPTIASTDAPTSAVVVVYTDAGVMDRAHNLPRNPDVVIVDPEVIVAAPVRFLVAGIGDALATWYEARSNFETRSNNYIAGGFPAPEAGLAIARHCHEVLMREALKAKSAAEAGLVTKSVEDIIEANTLLSGLGFENCGVSGAHGIHDGLTVLDEVHGFLHGEKVAFGIVCLLVLENRPRQEIEETIRFCRAVGLPTTLADLKIVDDVRAKAERVAEQALKGFIIKAVPVELSVAVVRDAILAADKLASSLPA